jgi:ABC-type antimicrobial peptide transport system permease subunit
LADLRSRIELVPGHGEAPLVIRTLEEQLNRTALSTLRIATLIIGAFAVTALLLSILGLFGALSDAARERRRQIAIRIALGARRWHLVRLTLSEGGRLALAGASAGTLASVLLSGTLARITPLNSPPSLWVWLAAPIVLAGAVAIASILPARHSSLVNPLAIMGDDN